MDLSMIPAPFIASIPAIVGAATSWFIESYAKPRGWSSRFVLVSIAIIVGVGYELFTTFVPLSYQMGILQFISSTIATGWGIYELLIRPAKGK